MRHHGIAMTVDSGCRSSPGEPRGGHESEVAGGGATHVPGCARERRGRQSQSALQWTTTSRDRIRHTVEGETEAHA